MSGTLAPQDDGPDSAALRAALLETFNTKAAIRRPFDRVITRLKLGFLHYAAPVIRLLWAVIRPGGLYLILRYDDAIFALADDSIFATPYRATMKALDTNGEVSLLGFGYSAEQVASYETNLCQVMRAMPLGMAQQAGTLAAERTQVVLEANLIHVDVVKDLLAPITINVANTCFGADLADRDDGLMGADAFLCWTEAISNFVFGGPKPPKYKRAAAFAAGRLVDMKLAPLIAAAKKAGTDFNNATTVLQRLAAVGLSEAEMQATFAGLLIGMLPNIPTAGAFIMQYLMAHPRAMAMARAAADPRTGDDERLGRCLVEALRFCPLMPVVFRTCVAPGGQWLGPPGRRRTHIPEGANVGVAVPAAMFDGGAMKNPYRYDPDRPASDTMVFGHGKHYCVGVPVAMAVLIAVFKPLLRRGPIMRAPGGKGDDNFLDFFPKTLPIAFGPVTP